MSANNNIINQYENRLNSLPEVNKQIIEQIKKYESLVDDQSTTIMIQIAKFLSRLSKSKPCNHNCSSLTSNWTRQRIKLISCLRQSPKMQINRKSTLCRLIIIIKKLITQRQKSAKSKNPQPSSKRKSKLYNLYFFYDLGNSNYQI